MDPTRVRLWDDKFSTNTERRAVPLRQLNLVGFFHVNLLVFESEVWSPNLFR